MFAGWSLQWRCLVPKTVLTSLCLALHVAGTQLVRVDLCHTGSTVCGESACIRLSMRPQGLTVVAWCCVWWKRLFLEFALRLQSASVGTYSEQTACVCNVHMSRQHCQISRRNMLISYSTACITEQRFACLSIRIRARARHACVCTSARLSTQRAKSTSLVGSALAEQHSGRARLPCKMPTSSLVACRRLGCQQALHSKVEQCHHRQRDLQVGSGGRALQSVPGES